MAFGRVAERGDERVLGERTMDAGALYPDPAAVNQAHLAQTSLVRRGDVLLDDRRHVTRREGVQVERVFDGNAVGHGALAGGLLRAPEIAARKKRAPGRRNARTPFICPAFCADL